MSTKGKTKKKPIETSLGKAPKDLDRVDLSHLKKPIITSLTNLRKILHLFKTATPEVQDYISYECDILFECKFCRSIFRSLANFILHKREYCREKSQFNHDEGGHVADDVSDLETPQKKPKTIEATLDKLLKNQKLNLTSQEETEKSDDDVIFVSENVVLENIDTSNVAKFQSVGNTGSKLEILEMHDMDDNQVALKPDGKICHFSANLKRPFACFECKVNFSTEKTLVHHVRVKHNKNSTVFLCPDCKEQFSSSMGVYRHLLTVHKRTNVQVRRLRNFVRSGRKDQQQEKKFPKFNSEEQNEDNQWLNNLEGDNDIQMCGGCGKRFERKAALMSHSQMCIKRIAVCNSIKNVKKPEKKEKMTGAAKRKAVLPTCRSKDNVTITKNVETVWLPAIPEMEIYTISDTESTDEKDEKSPNKVELPEISPSVEISLVKVKKITTEKDPMECQKVDIGQDDKEICQTLDTCEKDEIGICQQVDTIDILDSPTKDSKKSPTGNFTEECREFLTDSEDWRFLTKIESHVDVTTLTCTQCDRIFPSTYTLIRHMSYHFSWFRYQCSKCSFLSFHRDDSTAHAYSQHNTPNALSDRTVLPIPMWKVLNKGHDFKNLDENEKIIENGELVDLSENEKGMPTLEEEKCEDAIVLGDEEMPNLCDDSVIVSDDDDEDEHLSKKIKVEPSKNGRPVRNRMRSIKTVQDDFIYDFGGALKTNDALAKSKKLKKSP